MSNSFTYNDDLNNKEINEYLNILKEGNKRFVEGNSIFPNTTIETRKKLVNKQRPIATVITCSDSRVPAETIFDVGIGDIFVIRTAGHVLDTACIGTLEYAVTHLHTKLVLVMGHTCCGAVKSAIECYDNHNENIYSDLDNLVERIKPSVKLAKQNYNDNEDIWDKSVDYNIYDTINYIKKSNAVINNMIEKQEIVIFPVKYNIESGVVDIID